MRQIISDDIWKSRIPQADRYYHAWATAFKCDILEEYYEGYQWRGQMNLAEQPYTLNEVFDIIQIKIAQFMPTFPKYNISTGPGNTDDFSSAADSAELKEHTLNTLIKNEKGHFVSEIEMAFRDSFFRFGMAEVSYGADWIFNPNAPKPLLETDVEKNVTRHGKIKKQPEELPTNERIYIKRIPPRTFRIGGNDHTYLNRCGWCGYYEFVSKEDLLALPGLINKDKIPEEGFYSSLYDEEPDLETRRADQLPRNTYKLWKIWDLRAKVQILLLDSPKLTIFQRTFKRLPFFDLRPDKRLTTAGFYPIPQVYHWLSPQDEINETLEQLRAHRRRFVRKFQVVEGQMDDTEIEKFESGRDGSLVKIKVENAIKPIDNAELGSATDKSLVVNQENMNRISGTSNQVQGLVDRSTATEAQLVNNRGQVRENKDRDRVVSWLCEIGREILLTARDKFIFGVWVELSSPEGEFTFGEVQDKKPIFKFVSQEDLKGGFDFRIEVDLTTMSADEQQKEKQSFIEFLSLLTQFPMIGFSPILVREAAFRVGYKNTKVIKEFQTMALAMEHGRQAGLQQGGGNAGQQVVQSQTPPAGAAIQKAQSSALTPGSVQ